MQFVLQSSRVSTGYCVPKFLRKHPSTPGDITLPQATSFFLKRYHSSSNDITLPRATSHAISNSLLSRPFVDIYPNTLYAIFINAHPPRHFPSSTSDITKRSFNADGSCTFCFKRRRRIAIGAPALLFLQSRFAALILCLVFDTTNAVCLL